ncbi:MAG: lamin tail domain-containing protein, partial [Candidatus Aenigmarchaeota archaeon]|nr:lamin tail domain-containing protein [Candidatus Aenigmarchaeota archaeon]MDW8160078.1 lamin tail domain-containing protein [Candidatus Aenigmarchaeota archaeon]
DGYSKSFIFSYNNLELVKLGGYDIIPGEYYEFLIIKFKDQWYGYFNKKLVFTKHDTYNKEIIGIGINSALCSITQYDFIEFCAQEFGELNPNKTLCYSIRKPSIYNKTLFITDENWKNILALSPLKIPTIVYKPEYKDYIDFFVESYKPEEVFLLGNVNYNGTKIELEELAMFFDQTSGVYADSFEKYLISSQIASLLNIPIVYSKENALLDFSKNSTEEIENFYLKLAKEKNLTLNYIILTNSPYSSVISSIKNGFIIFINSTNASIVKNKLNEKVKKLNLHNFLFNNSKNILKGNYLLLFGVPHFLVDDPVEKQKFLGFIDVADEEDGSKLLSDVIYADVNNDGYLDFSFGRLSEDQSLASLVFSRSFLDTTKNALVASEYLHQNFLNVLLYAGGGMLNGRNVAEILESKGYNVTRLVERRVNHLLFLNDLKPSEIIKFIITYEGLKRTLEKFISSTLSTALVNTLLVLKGLEFSSESLMCYFEYDWSKFAENYMNVLQYLEQKESNNETLHIDDIINIVSLLWPTPWPELNETNLKNHMPEASIIFYEGLGNGSLWILPNNFEQNSNILSYSFWIQQISNYQYNGSRMFKKEDIPYLKARIVWDNSDFAGIGSMKDEFLKKGSASFIGASAINYSPFTGELSSRFFSKGETLGEAFKYAHNSFLSDFLTLDLLNLNKPGIKSKTLLEFIIYGDPSIPKEGKLEHKELVKYFSCNDKCELKVLFTPEIKYENGNLEINSSENLIEENEPIIPVKRFVYHLPGNSSIEEKDVKVNLVQEKVFNATLPKISAISHAGKSFEPNKTKITVKSYGVRIDQTLDGRKEIEVVVPSLIYNETEKSIILVKNVSISMSYETPLDFEIETEDVEIGKNATIKFRIFSKVEGLANLYLEISNSSHSFNFTLNFTLENKEMEIYFNFTPETHGKYKVKAVLEVINPLVAGPREEIFEVYEPEEEICQPKIRINEIMYNPKGNDAGREWIEIFNYGDCSVNLTNWYFYNKNSNHRIYLKMGSYVLRPGEYAIISNNATRFLEEYKNFGKALFQSSFSLLNTNDTIEIRNSSKNTIHKIFYSKDFGGYDNNRSLELDEETLTLRESYVEGGTPGSPNSKLNESDRVDYNQSDESSSSSFASDSKKEGFGSSYKNPTNIVSDDNSNESIDQNQLNIFNAQEKTSIKNESFAMNKNQNIEKTNKNFVPEGHETIEENFKEESREGLTGFFILNDRLLLSTLLLSILPIFYLIYRRYF